MRGVHGANRVTEKLIWGRKTIRFSFAICIQKRALLNVRATGLPWVIMCRAMSSSAKPSRE